MGKFADSLGRAEGISDRARPEEHRNRDTASQQRRQVASRTRPLPSRHPMLLSLVYFTLRRLLHALASSGRSDFGRETEPLVLRHQVKVLSRGRRRPPFRRRDRILLASASRILPRERWRAFVVTPPTLLRWHRELVRRRWTYRRCRPGRPLLDRDTWFIGATVWAG